jgi:hypothetical protein
MRGGRLAGGESHVRQRRSPARPGDTVLMIPLLRAFEKLNLTPVLFGCLACAERSQGFFPVRASAFLEYNRYSPVFEFSDHIRELAGMVP